jgi:UDP-2,3-diacylglucosamine hydrolase
MRGNRDFLLDVEFAGKSHTRFSAQTQATMLDDPTLLKIGQHQVLLMHGDSLCTDDQAYQDFRAQNRTKQWQQAFLSEPLSRRMQVAQSLREQSKAHQREMANEIADVNDDAVDQMLSTSGVSTLLHGHTHRPDMHQWSWQGQQRTRYVLPDWDQTERRGGFIRIDKAGLSTVSLAAG